MGVNYELMNTFIPMINHEIDDILSSKEFCNILDKFLDEKDYIDHDMIDICFCLETLKVLQSNGTMMGFPFCHIEHNTESKIKDAGICHDKQGYKSSKLITEFKMFQISYCSKCGTYRPCIIFSLKPYSVKLK